MSNISSSESALDHLWKSFVAPSQFPFLKQQADDYIKRKPLQGSKILHSIPCSIEAACKAIILSVGGAELTIRSMKGIIPQSQPQAIKLLESAGLRFIGDSLPSNETFDIHLDCSAETIDMKAPRVGSVELTQSGSKIYLSKELTYPVISLDLTQVKMIETYMGTGESYCRAFIKTISDHISSHTFIVFGSGKVGSGVVHHLKGSRAKVFCVDSMDEALMNIKSIADDFCLFTDKNKLNALIERSTVVVTATGKQGFISEHFNASDFRGKVLTNIGAEDEYGSKFSKDSVANNKQPINFALSDPTVLHYLDPVFFAHNKSAELLLESPMKPGIHSLPNELDQSICKRWQEIHHEDLPFLKRSKKALSL